MPLVGEFGWLELCLDGLSNIMISDQEWTTLMTGREAATFRRGHRHPPVLQIGQEDRAHLQSDDSRWGELSVSLLVFFWRRTMIFQDTVSVHRPGFYAERFLNFMSEKIFKKIPSCKFDHFKTDQFPPELTDNKRINLCLKYLRQPYILSH